MDADLRVGALEETITVTGEAPIVDTRRSRKQQVLNSDVVDALPSARNYFGLARMIPGTLGGGNDVGGSLIQDVGQSVTVHGSRNTDQRVTANGVNTMTLQAGGNIGGQTPDVGSAAEVTVDTDVALGRPADRRRAHQLHPARRRQQLLELHVLHASRTRALQGDNFSDELRRRAWAPRTRSSTHFDLNESIGGPFKRDKVWFWFSTRYQHDRERGAGLRQQERLQARNEWLYVPDHDAGREQGHADQQQPARHVAGEPAKIKIAGTYKADKWCNCPNNISATRAPEAGRDRRFPRLRQEHAEWTSPITNQLLFEAVGLHLFERWGNMHLRVNGGSLDDPAIEAGAAADDLAVTEQSTGLRLPRHRCQLQQHRGAELHVSRGDVVCDRHARVQVRVQQHHGYLDENQYTLNPVGLPVQQRRPEPDHERATRTASRPTSTTTSGFFVQDRWIARTA